MSRANGTCTICRHGERGSMELLLAGGASVKAVAVKFGASSHALYRHWVNHVTDERKLNLRLGPVERAALAARVSEESHSVLDHLKVARSAIYEMLHAALGAGDRVGVAMLVGRLHENLRELGRLTGELSQSPLIQNNTLNVFINDPAFASFQADLIRTLSRFPEAREAVIAEFERLEVQSAALPALEHHSNGA